MRRLASFLTILVCALVWAGSGARADTVLRVETGGLGTLDPALASDYADSILMFNAYDTLLLPAQGKPGVVPHLAKSWSGKDTVYTFVLRDDVRFHSGNALTADDVVFSLQRMQALNGPLAYLFSPVKSAKAVDSHTVQFDLETPYASFPAALLRLPIVDKDLILANLGDGSGDMKDWGRAFLSANAAGTGAYRIDDHGAGVGATLSRNADYFLDIPKMAPERVELSYGLTADEARSRLKEKTLDITSQWLPPDTLRTMAREGVTMLTEPGRGGFYGKMNTQKAPLDDAQCRLALANAFDYQAAHDMLAVSSDVSLGRPATGAIPVGMLGANSPSAQLKQDIDAAKQQLDSCRYDPADVNLQIVWIEGAPLEKQIAELMAKNFGELGLTADIASMTWSDFVGRVADPATTPLISLVYDYSATGDPDALLFGMYASNAVSGWQSAEHLDDTQVDEWLAKGRTATSQHDRATAYRSLNARLMAITPTIYIFDRVSVFASGDRVSVPALSASAKRFELPGMGFSFRLMEMKESPASK